MGIKLSKVPVPKCLVSVRVEIHNWVDALDLVVVVGASEHVVRQDVKKSPVARVEGGNIQIVPN